MEHFSQGTFYPPKSSMGRLNPTMLACLPAPLPFYKGLHVLFIVSLSPHPLPLPNFLLSELSLGTFYSRRSPSVGNLNPTMLTLNDHLPRPFPLHPFSTTFTPWGALFIVIPLGIILPAWVDPWTYYLGGILYAPVPIKRGFRTFMYFSSE